jgi:hypothetical protein
VIVNGEGHFVLEGRHFIKQNRIDIHRAQKLTDEYICAGTRHRIVVPQGRLGLALESGAPCIYDPNSVHLINSSLFEYRGSVDVTQQLIVHASLKIITVKDGQVGITYNNGVLEMLQTGRHTIEKATHGARCCACECARAFFGCVCVQSASPLSRRTGCGCAVCAPPLAPPRNEAPASLALALD